MYNSYGSHPLTTTQPTEAAMNDVVLYTTSILEIGELEVFTRAYEAWYGTADEEDVEVAYSSYFKSRNPDEVPPWVRHYCRREIAKFLEKEKGGDSFHLFTRWCMAKARLLLTIGTTP